MLNIDPTCPQKDIYIDYKNRIQFRSKPNTELYLPVKVEFSSYKVSPKTGDTLYYSKRSKISRTVAQSCGYKRCVKPSKADCVICPIWTVQEVSIKLYFQSANTYYILSVPNQYDENLIINNILKTDFNIQYIGKAKSYKYAYHDGALLKAIINGEITHLCDDKEFGLMLGTTMEDFTDESFESIKSMITSQDLNIVALGLKSLIGINTTKYPLTISVLLGLNDKIKECPAWNSALVNQIKLSIYPAQLRSWCPPTIRNGTYSEEDLKYFNILFKEYLNIRMQDVVSNLQRSWGFDFVHPTIKYTIE